MRRGCGNKGYTRAGTYGSKQLADKRASSLKGKFLCIKVKKGVAGVAWGRPRTVYRVWVK